MDTRRGFWGQKGKEMKLRGPQGIYREGVRGRRGEEASGGEELGFWDRRIISTI